MIFLLLFLGVFTNIHFSCIAMDRPKEHSSDEHSSAVHSLAGHSSQPSPSGSQSLPTSTQQQQRQQQQDSPDPDEVGDTAHLLYFRKKRH